MFYKKTYLLIVIGIFSFFHANSQITITGTILDAIENKGISGVEVNIIGTTIKTQLIMKGNLLF
ncbi:MAG: hypothetical protein IPH57_04090 [Saprospiraceae bacterium]|nr:hypothetical protein [Saprospiraceae bacterium]